MRFHVGTSGYSYPEWKGDFYPEKTKPADMLRLYAERLPAVEINNTFYRMPRRSVLAGWMEQVPDTFRFVIKASRRITHHRRLKEAADELYYLYRSVNTLEERLGCVLYQTPPYLKKDLERLDAFLRDLPGGSRCAFEFQHETWQDAETAELLRAQGHALVTVDREGERPAVHAGGDWGYLRLRGAKYDDAELGEWLEALRGSGWSEAFVFFKHEEECAGPRLAERMLQLAGER